MLSSDTAKKIRTQIKEKSIRRTVSEYKHEDQSDTISFGGRSSDGISKRILERSQSIGSISRVLSSESSSPRVVDLSSISGPTLADVKHKFQTDSKHIPEKFRKIHLKNLQNQLQDSDDSWSDNETTESQQLQVGKNHPCDEIDILPPSPTCLDVRLSNSVVKVGDHALQNQGLSISSHYK